MDDTYIETPGTRGLFCHNELCPCNNIDKVPEDFQGPVTLNFGWGDQEVYRRQATSKRYPRKVFWLCDICDNAVKLAYGVVDPHDLAVKTIKESSIIRPN